MKNVISILLISIPFFAIAQADKYFNQGMEETDPAAKIESFSRAIQKDPYFSSAYYNRAIVKNSIKDYQGAIQDYQKTTEIDSAYLWRYMKDINTLDEFAEYYRVVKEFSSSYFNSGNARFQLKDYLGAVNDYDQSIQFDSLYLIAYRNRQVAPLALIDYYDALVDYAECYYNRANTKYVLNDYAGAIADYTRTLELNLGQFQAYMSRGKARLSLNVNFTAIEDFSQAIRFDPNSHMVFFYRAVAKYKLGYCAEAEADLKLSNGLEKDQVDTILGLALTAMCRNDMPTAKKYLDAAEKIQGAQKKDIHQFANSYWYQDDFDALKS